VITTASRSLVESFNAKRAWKRASGRPKYLEDTGALMHREHPRSLDPSVRHVFKRR
jgi:hypothetical protein